MGWKGEAQSLFEKPIYDPVFNMNNEIFVFNFEDNIINHYDNRAEKLNTFPLTFHKQRRCQKQDSYGKNVHEVS